MNTTPGSLRLPSQAAPIDRTSSPAALDAAGINASGLWDDITSVAGPLLQQAAQAGLAAAPSILSSIPW
jgi:hypothetical protein